MKSPVIAAAFALVLLGGCAALPSKSEVALVDVTRITGNWPKFVNYQNQLAADQRAIEESKAPANQKQRQYAELQARFVQFQQEITGDVRTAAEQVAKEKSYKLVLTRQGVGYGGIDITTDVEKVLKIEEKATPKP